MIIFKVNKESEGQSLEKFVRKCLKEAPLSFIYKLFRKKDVKVNGHWQDMKYVISSNEEVSIYITDSQLEEFKRQVSSKELEDISSWVIYEDDNILLINKPRGVLVQKAVDSDIALDDMVVSLLQRKGEYDPSLSIGFKPAPIHRLDRNTAGLIIFAKNLLAAQYLNRVITDKDKIQKKYITLVKGRLCESGKIDKPLTKVGVKTIVDEVNGKESLTTYYVIKYIGNYSLTEVTLHTGRNHQIRVHFASIGHPVVGDSRYGDYGLNHEIEKKYGFKNQFLIAKSLEFHHLESPLEYLNEKKFEVKIPKECLDLLKSLGDNN